MPALQENVTSSRARPSRRRRWLRVLLALAVVTGIVLLVDHYLNPRLHPITRRLLPLGYELRYAGFDGYPVVQAHVYGEDADLVRLDARCRPVPGVKTHMYEYTAHSPGWRYIADAGVRYPGTQMEVTLTPVGGLPVTVRPPGFTGDEDGKNCFSLLDDSGIFADAAGHLYTLDGKPLHIAANGWHYYPTSYVATGPGILPLLRCRPGECPAEYQFVLPRLKPVTPASAAVCLYDTRRRKIIFAHDFSDLSDVEVIALLRDRDRTAAIIDEASTRKVLVCHGSTRVKFFTANYWDWTDDGSIWAAEDADVHCLRWRRQTPDVVTIRDACDMDGRFSNPEYDSQPPLGFTLWHDGELTVQARTIQLVPAPVVGLADRIARALRHKPCPTEARRITLYRHGKRVGMFTTRLKPNETAYREHLAFTADGNYLSWAIDAGYGWQVYAFPTR